MMDPEPLTHHLAAALREKDDQIKRLQTDLQEITEQFELNWNLIATTDSKIKSLQNDFEEARSELGSINATADLHSQNFRIANGKLTDIENHDAEICSNIHDLTNQLNKIRFEIAKMKSTEATPIYIPIEADVSDLRARHDDLMQRVAEAKLLTETLHAEGSKEITDAELQCENERLELSNEIARAQHRQDHLIANHQNVESEVREIMGKLEAECKAVELSIIPSDSPRCELTEEIRVLSRELEKLEDLVRQQRLEEAEKRSMITTIETRLDERQQTIQAKFLELQATVEKEESKIVRVRQRLESQIARNSDLEKVMDQTEREPFNYAEYVTIEQAKLSDLHSAEREPIAAQLKETRDRNKFVAANAREIAENCDSLAVGMQKTAEDIQKRHGYTKKQKSKLAALSIRLNALEGELAALQSIKLPSPEEEREIQRIKQFQRALLLQTANMTAAMQKLVDEEMLIRQRVDLLKDQNGELKEDLVHYNKIKRYYLTHQPMRPGIVHGLPPETQRKPARLVLEFNEVDIHAN